MKNGYAGSAKELEKTLSYFFDTDVFLAMRGRVSEPELLKMAVIEAFLYPLKYENHLTHWLRIELIYLQEHGVFFYVHNRNTQSN
jgi:hypothetical protein